MDDVRLAAPNAKILNGERARFEVAGGNFRMVVAFDFGRRVAFIKFIGTHAEYDRIDALTVLGWFGSTFVSVICIRPAPSREAVALTAGMERSR